MNKNIQPMNPPLKVEAINNLYIWWSMSFRSQKFDCSIWRAEQLHRNGLQAIGDFWNAQFHQFESWTKVKDTYQVEEYEHYIWKKVIDMLETRF